MEDRSQIRLGCVRLLFWLGTVALAARAGDPNGRIFFLDYKGRVLSANPDGSGVHVIVQGITGGPDGIAIDPAHSHIYWTNMGVASANDGSIQRADLDGSHVTAIVPAGGTFTPKQLKLDAAGRKLYWSDREGMRVMRSDLGGSRIETLVETGRGDQARRDPRNWCVGIAIDPPGGKIYWTQKGGSIAGQGSLRRAGVDIPKGRTAANRDDIEVLFEGLPEPIDLDLDLTARMIYWTDRGDPPRGNSVSRAPMDRRGGQEILVTGLHEGIGIALDPKRGRMFFTDLGGNVYGSRLDGTGMEILLSGQGSLTGIAYVEVAH